MASVSEKLHKWAIQELNLVSEGCMQEIPSIENLRGIITSKNKRIWLYVINHVRAQYTVEKIKRTLLLKQKSENEEISMPYLLEKEARNLRQARVDASAKHSSLESSISVIQERIMKVEKNIEQSNEETFKYYQQNALLDILAQKQEQKNISLQDKLNKIIAFQKISNSIETLNSNKTISLAQSSVRSRDTNLHNLLGSVRKVLKDSENHLPRIIIPDENSDDISKNLANTFAENRLSSKDLVTVLKLICDSSIDEFMNLSSQNEAETPPTEKSDENSIISHMPHGYVFNFFHAKKSLKICSDLLKLKEQFCDKIKSSANHSLHSDFSLRCDLFLILAENEGYAKSNANLKQILFEEREEVSKINNLNCQLIQNIKRLQLVKLDFSKNIDLYTWLANTAPLAFECIISDASNVHNFAHQELFSNMFTLNKSPIVISQLFELDRKLMWKYCQKNDLIQPFLYNKTELFQDLLNILDILPFQSINKVCSKLMHLKNNMFEKSLIEKFCLSQICRVDVFKQCESFTDKLQHLNCSLTKASLNIDKSSAKMNAIKDLLVEWWEQNAQFIPDIVYEDKPLKLWLDVLSALTEF